MKKEIPIEVLERELHGLDVELAWLREQHKTVTARISWLERERFALWCQINARKSQE